MDDQGASDRESDAKASNLAEVSHLALVRYAGRIPVRDSGLTGAASLPSPIRWSPHHPGDPVRASRQLRPWRHGPAQCMLRLDVPGAVRKPMSTAKLFRAVCLALGFALLGSACTGPPRDAGRNGVRGGTLRVLSADDIDGLDTAVTYTPNSIAIARAYARTLYSYNLAGPPEQKTVPVPDIAAGPPQLSADRRTYSFTLRAGVHYAPRSTAKSPPPTSSPPSSGSTTRPPPRPGSSTRTSSPAPQPSAPERPAASRA